jgi:branched-chain amino acid transport system ATP-binding protein
MLLEIRDIRVHYEKVEAVKGISLAAEQGMISTLIGANRPARPPPCGPSRA